MTISEKIFDILEKKEMSQKEFSEKAGISQSTISDWKRKKTNPAADKIMAVCDALQITPLQLLGGDKAGAGDLWIRTGSEEYLLVETFRGLGAAQKGRVLGYLQAIAEGAGQR